MQNQVRNWTKIWKIERMFYKITDEISLPRPVSQTFAIWFVVMLVLSFRMNGIFPFFSSSASVNHLGIPFAFAWLMNQKTFQGKKPHNYLLSVVRFVLRPKVTCRGKKKIIHEIQNTEHTVLIREKELI